MKTKKLIRYAIPCSTRFPSTHCRKGEPTYFVEQILNVILYGDDDFLGTDGEILYGHKLYTIRNNKNNVWTKRMKKVLEGKAVIDLFYWKLPGGRWTKDNEQIVFATLDKDSGCGVQLIRFIDYDVMQIAFPNVDTHVIAKNDGLSIDDFKSWFKRYDLSEVLAIIHFTKFRY